MEFENYAKGINSVKDVKTFGQNLPEKQKQNRFAIKQNEMALEAFSFAFSLSARGKI